MATFYDGDINTFGAMTYGETHPNTMRFMESMFQTPTLAMSQAGEQFVEKARETYDKFMGSQAMRTARAAARQVKSQWQENVIRPLRDVGELQNAPLKMQRYMMAEPTMRHMYHHGRCDGYSDTYVDREPNVIGHGHYDFRRVTDGIAQITDEELYWVEYFEDLLPEDKELLFEEQFDIMRSWAVLAQQAMEGGDDPTSIWNAEL